MSRVRLQRVESRLRQRSASGFAILLFLTVILLALTSFLAAEVSVNQRRFANDRVGIDGASNAQDALLGYALSHTVPGTLPCPDTTGDGLENAAGLQCVSQLGLLPWRTLGLGPVTDGTGALLWYAVEINYVANAVGAKNSSRTSTLNVDGDLVAFVVIAAGQALDSQTRRPLIRADFLEGVNVDNNLMNFSAVLSPMQNDRLSAVSKRAFWSLVEARAVASVRVLLRDYREACGEYPWAAPFGGTSVSVNNQQAGGPPFLLALPFDWGSVCPLGVAPTPDSWLIAHWRDQLYYRMCTSLQGNCLAISGVANPSAAAVVIAPGIALAGQVRPAVNPVEYFEGANSSPPDTQFARVKPINHLASYNDVTQPINP